jgi:hypothetical protein
VHSDDIASPEHRRYEAHSWRVARMATELSMNLGTVQIQARRLEERLCEAARNGVPRSEAQAMLYGLDGIDVAGMLDRAYGEQVS